LVSSGNQPLSSRSAASCDELLNKHSTQTRAAAATAAAT
jgi:hypothetical protein